jgi:hypothetical protein
VASANAVYLIEDSMTDTKRDAFEAWLNKEGCLLEAPTKDQCVDAQHRAWQAALASVSGGESVVCALPSAVDGRCPYARPAPSAPAQDPVASEAAVPEGWKLVPVEPTDEMIHAVMLPGPGYRFKRPGLETSYRLMVAAAPQPAQPTQSCGCGVNCLDKGAMEGCRYADRPAQPCGDAEQADEAVDTFLAEVRAELIRARAKFPGDRIMTIALAEEFGELCKAVLDESAANVRKEAVQTAVMCARVALDGDGSVNNWRAERGLDPLVKDSK